MTSPARTPERMRLRTVVPVWVAAVVIAVLIGVFAREDGLAWMAVGMAVLVLFTFVLQLAIVQREGLVDRMMASIAGGIAVLAVATLVLALI